MKRALENLTHPDERIRKEALIRLSASKDIRLMPVLMQIADRDPSIEIRFFAKKALAELKEAAQASHELASSALSFPTAPPSEAREIATPPPSVPPSPEQAPPPAAKLGEAPPSERAIAPPPSPEANGETEGRLIARRLRAQDPFARIKVIQELVQLRHEQARQEFVELLAEEKHPHVRATLAIAIGIVGQAEDAELLIGLLGDANPRIRANVIEGLGHLGNPAACPHITPLVKDGDNRVRSNALTALARFQRGELLAGLSKMIDSKEVAERDSAAYALVKLELPDAIPLLERLLEDGEISIRLKARNGLVKLAKQGHEKAMQALCSWGGDRANPDAFLSMSVIERLPVPVGLDAANRDDRLRAIQRVTEVCDDSQGLALFRRLAVEEDERVKASLIIALGQLGIRESFDTIVAYLRNEDPRIRANAVEALGLLGPSKAAPLIFPLLDAGENRIRANAVVALSHCPHVNLIPTLKAMCESQELSTRASAIYAITELAQARFTGLLIPLLRDSAPAIRRKAVDSLKILANQGIPTASTILTRWGPAPERE